MDRSDNTVLAPSVPLHGSRLIFLASYCFVHDCSWLSYPPERRPFSHLCRCRDNRQCLGAVETPSRQCRHPFSTRAVFGRTETANQVNHRRLRCCLCPPHLICRAVASPLQLLLASNYKMRAPQVYHDRRRFDHCYPVCQGMNPVSNSRNPNQHTPISNTVHNHRYPYPHTPSSPKPSSPPDKRPVCVRP